ncbi:F-box domain containing protein [Tanacetum coccineum]
MHNNIMAAGSRDRPPMLATGRYAQWRSLFLRYIDTRPNGDALRKCILKGPYTPTIVTTLVVPATEDSPTVPEQTTLLIVKDPPVKQYVDAFIDEQEDKTTVFLENVKHESNKSQYFNVVKDDYKPCLASVFSNVKPKRKKRGFERNYVLRSVKERKRRLTMSLDSPYGQQASTTTTPPKTRSQSVNGDFIAAPDFEEDVSGAPKIRPHNCKKEKVTLPDGFTEFLKMQDPPEYRFPWGYRDIAITRAFWYPVAWRDVEKVYFPVNEPKKHWCLAELHISTRVVTFYDSLGYVCGNRRPWWRTMKRNLPQQLTLYLNQHGVLKSKGISVESYEIKYMFPKVVEQADLYGDCGVWIMKRLPAKSLLQFCTVSKSWKSCIDSATFFFNYGVRKSINDVFYLTYNHGFQGSMISVDENLIHIPVFRNLVIANLKPIGTSQGIWGFSYGNNFMVCITNPSIHKEIVVFVPTQLDSCKILLGFGVWPDNLDPTVVKFSYPSFGEGNWSVYVFTLSSLTWNQLNINRLPCDTIRFKRSTQAVVGQFIYWVGHERLMRGLLVLLYVSNLRDSLVLCGNIPIPAYYVFVCCQLSIDGGSITSAPAIMTMPSHHFLKLLGFNNHDLPIMEAATGHIIGHTMYMENSQSFENVTIQGNVGSFFVGTYKELLILAAYPNHLLHCAS